MISGVTAIDDGNDSPANILCKSCGLCCTGHLFVWVKLRPAELDSAEAQGLTIFRSDPSQRGFSQPCPLWKGQCTIHATPQYPRACRAYNCKLLKEVIGEDISLADAITAVEQAKERIRELEPLLPDSLKVNFRERLVAFLENAEGPDGSENADPDIWQAKANELLLFYESVFGVKDLVEDPE